MAEKVSPTGFGGPGAPLNAIMVLVSLEDASSPPMADTIGYLLNSHFFPSSFQYYKVKMSSAPESKSLLVQTMALNGRWHCLSEEV